MTNAKRVILIAAFFFSAGTLVEASPILFLVRHAEKTATGGNDPELSFAGHERAEALARILKDSEITAIFTSEFKRTQQTAVPTAKATRITPTIVPANDVAALVEKLRSLKGNALVVGHGNTIPDLAKELGIITPVNISENDYNELFVVILGDNPQVLRLHYPT